jgi:Fe2+ transport system protein B
MLVSMYTVILTFLLSSRESEGLTVLFDFYILWKTGSKIVSLILPSEASKLKKSRFIMEIWKFRMFLPNNF